MSTSTKPLSVVGVPRHRDARSRKERRVSMIIWMASRRSLRVCRLDEQSGGHFAGCLYHALARSAARDRMRGKPPLPLRIGCAGRRFGVEESWPQRLPMLIAPIPIFEELLPPELEKPEPEISSRFRLFAVHGTAVSMVFINSDCQYVPLAWLCLPLSMQSYVFPI